MTRRVSGTHRAALQEGITQSLVALTGDRASAEQRAAEAMEQRARRTQLGVGVGLLTVALTGLAVWRGMSNAAVLSIGIGGGMFAGHTWSGGYLGASLKDFAATVGAALKSVAGGLGALVRAKDGKSGDG